MVSKKANSTVKVTAAKAVRQTDSLKDMRFLLSWNYNEIFSINFWVYTA